MNTNKRFYNLLLVCVILFFGTTRNAIAQDHIITDYGALNDNSTINTAAIQSAIDAASSQGGGRVVVPQGTFLTGTVFLKNDVELHLSENAVLKGSLNYSDYQKTYRWFALIGTKGADNISITGTGTIDGQGFELATIINTMYHNGEISDPNYNHHRGRPSENVRPQLIELGRCNGITVKDITLKNSSCMVQAYYDSTNILIDNVTVESTAFWNNDGLDIYDCHDVVVSNCTVNSADDGICLKTRGYSGSGSDNITVKDCSVRSSASAVKFGTTSLGYFRNITIRNIEVHDTYRSAIAIETVDGGDIENVLVSNINATNTGNAIFVRTGHRKGGAPGVMKNIRIEKIKVQVPTGKPDAGYPMEGPVPGGTFNLVPSSIVGLPDSRIENIVLDDIEITFGGGGTKSKAYIPLDQLDRIPEQRNSYPEFHMFGELPATGFFVRNVNDITMSNIKITVENNDYRPSLVFDAAYDVTIENCELSPTNTDPQVILSSSVTGTTLSNITATNGISNLVTHFPSALNNSLVAYWDFDETSGTQAEDQISGFNGVVNTNHVTMGVEGYSGTAYKFDGVDDNLPPVDLSAHTDLLVDIAGFRKDVSFSGWFKFDDLSSNNTIFSVCSAESGSKYIQLGLNRDEKTFAIQRTPADGINGLRADPVSTEQWHHIVYVIDADVGQFVYVDGMLNGFLEHDKLNFAGNFDGFYMNRIALGCLYKGDTADRPSDYFTGEMDELKVYSSALSSGDVSQLYSIYKLGTDDDFSTPNVNEGSNISIKYLLHTASNQATICFDIRLDSEVVIDVFDMTGKKVKAIAEGFYSRGQHDISWDLSNTTGSHMSSAFYFIRMVANGQVITKKILVP